MARNINMLLLFLDKQFTPALQMENISRLVMKHHLGLNTGNYNTKYYTNLNV